MTVHKIGSYLPEVWCWCEWKKTHEPERRVIGMTLLNHIGNDRGEGAIVVPIDEATQQGVCPMCGDVCRTTEWEAANAP